MNIDADTKTTPPSSKSLSFTNGTNKRHSTATPTATSPPSMVVFYKECLKNHAASIGGHALDGCGEFMPSSSINPADPRSLKCAACGCHRNFHRREPQEPSTTTNNNNNPSFLNCIYSPSAPPPPPPPQLPHRGLAQSPSPSLSSSPSPSPSPISSPSPPPISHLPPSYNTSAPHMLLALGSAYSAPSDGNTHTHAHTHNHNLNFSTVKMESVNLTASAKKRYRTKFSKEQKEKMYSFSEKLGWRMQKGDDGLVQQFCNDIGVSRAVFKVWMHNNKNTFSKKRSELGNSEASQNDEKMNDSGNAAAAGFDSDINNPYNPNSGSNNDVRVNEDSCVNNVHASLNGLSS